MRKVLVFAPALLLLACKTDYTVNGNGNIFGNNNGPSSVPSASVTPAPSPSVSPTATPGADPCAGLLPVPMGKCVPIGDQRFGAFLHSVQATVVPIPSEAAYVAAVVAAVKKAGVCAAGGIVAGASADEVTLRVDSSRVETYDVFNRDGLPQPGIYICTSFPIS